MTNQKATIGNDVKNFVLQEFLVGADPDELTETTPLIEGGILDSLGMIKMLTFLEERYKVTLEADAAQLATIKNIVELVAAKL